MRHARFTTLAAFAAALSACSVAPVMRPESRLGVNRMATLEAKAAADPAKAAAEYRKFLKAHQYFDQAFVTYGESLDATMKSLGQGGTAREVPVDGIPYYYVQHVAQLARANLKAAQACFTAKDYPRAERHAFNAIELVERRALLSSVVVTEIEEQAWKLLVEVFKEQGFAGNQVWARSQWQWAFDHMISPDGVKSYQDYARLRSEGEESLNKANGMISELNAQKAAETANAFAAAAAAAGSAMASYQEAQVRAQANSQGYMTADQASLIQLSQLNRSMSNMLLMQTLNNAGRWGNTIAVLHSFANPRMFQQFTQPSAGLKTTEIMQEFTRRATKLGRGNLAITRQATALSGLTTNLDKARNSGNTQRSRSAFEKMLPVYTDLTQRLRQVK